MKVREIAAVFGVAPSTVSLVLNGKPGVGDELRKSIEEKLIENGYTIKKEQEERGQFCLFITSVPDICPIAKTTRLRCFLGGCRKSVNRKIISVL